MYKLPGAILPAIPFPFPVPPPVLGTGRVMVSIDVGWLPYVIGACKVLTANSTYDPPTVADVVNAVKAAYDLLADLEDGYFRNPCPSLSGSVGASGDEVQMIRQNPTNPCLLETSIDGVNWCVFADFSKCVSTAGPGSGQPQPQPGGGCQTYDFLHRASDTTNLGVVVNTGDTLQLLSASGAGSDGTLDWYCSDGELFIGGACVGGQHTVGTDPLPTTNHMQLLWYINGVYYPVTSTLFTVPGSVTNKPVYLVNNDSSLGDNSGQYSVSVQVCNNQAASGSWCHYFDFTQSPQGFSSFAINDANGQPFTPAQWVSGQGWVAQNVMPPPSTTWEWYFGISRDMGSSQPGNGWIANVQGQMGIHQVTDFFDVGLDVSAAGDTFSGAVVALPQPASNSPYNESGTLAGSAARYLKVRYIQYSIVTPTTPAFVLSSLKLSGTGVNPFGSSNCP